MPQVVIENPVLNAPYDEPRRHFRFSDDGITDEIIDTRRVSSYFMPIAAPKKRDKQPAMDTEWTKDCLQENDAATTIVVPITSRLPAKEYPFMVRLPDDLLPRPSAAVCALMRVVATKRLVEGPLATCDAATMARVDTALRHTLALAP